MSVFPLFQEVKNEIQTLNPDAARALEGKRLFFDHFLHVIQIVVCSVTVVHCYNVDLLLHKVAGIT